MCSSGCRRAGQLLGQQRCLLRAWIRGRGSNRGDSRARTARDPRRSRCRLACRRTEAGGCSAGGFWQGGRAGGQRGNLHVPCVSRSASRASQANDGSESAWILLRDAGGCPPDACARPGRRNSGDQFDQRAGRWRTADPLHADQGRCALADAVLCHCARSVWHPLQRGVARDDRDRSEQRGSGLTREARLYARSHPTGTTWTTGGCRERRGVSRLRYGALRDRRRGAGGWWPVRQSAMTAADGTEDDSRITVVDPHIHLWDTRQVRYPWLEQRQVAFSGDNRLLPDPYTVATFLQDAHGIEVRMSVHVEANPADPLAEVQWLQSMADDPENLG